jgi:hypothetical protein
LLLAPGGERLAKRTRPASVASLRLAGVPPARVIGALAASAGLAPAGTECTAAALVDRFDLQQIDRRPAVAAEL